MKKILALIVCFALVLSLTGCMGSGSSKADDVARSTVIVKNGEETLAVTPETTEAPATDENGEPVDNNVYNAVAAGDTLTISGTGSIQTVTYRVNGGEIVVEKAAQAELTVSDGMEKLEAYVTDAAGIVSLWATYYFE